MNWKNGKLLPQCDSLRAIVPEEQMLKVYQIMFVQFWWKLWTSYFAEKICFMFLCDKRKFEITSKKANYVGNWRSILCFIHIDIMVGWLWLAIWFGDDGMVGF